jgi:membrane associated rhomboid family serine protease
MANPSAELLEIILRECAAREPHPWYPSVYLQTTDVPREELEPALDRLRLNGLVKLTEWIPGHGQGYQLTPHGAEVLRHPRLLGRLRQGDVPAARPEPAAEPLVRHPFAESRGEQVRQSLLSDSRPIVTQLLLAANIFWFFVGMVVYVWRYGGNAVDYVVVNPLGGGQANLTLAYLDIGSLFVVDVMDRQQWWRMLSSGFVHLGILHILMNMYALYSLGPMLERMWGRAAYLGIYLFSCLGSSAVALVFMPTGNHVGASGAICGLLGSFGTWLYLNRRYLPRHQLAAWQQTLMINIVLLVIISLSPNVSWAGHLGGGLTGAMVALPLSLVTYGHGPRRWLGWAGAAAIAVVGLCLMYQPLQTFAASDQMDRARRWEHHVRGEPVVARNQRDLAEDPTTKLLEQGEEIAVDTRNAAAKLINAVKPDAPKDPARAKEFREGKNKLEQKISALTKVKKFFGTEQAEAVKAGLTYFEATATYFGKLADTLEKEGAWTAEERAELFNEHNRSGALRAPFLKAWEKMAKAWAAK